MLLIGNLGNLDLGEGSNGAKQLVSELQGMLLPLLAALWIIVLILVLLTTKKRKDPRKSASDRSAPGFLLGLLLILSIVVIGAALSGNPDNHAGGQNTATDGGTNGDTQEQTPAPTIGTAAFSLVALALTAAVIVAAVLVIRRGLRPTSVPDAEPSSSAEALEPPLSFTEAIAELETQADPRSAILAAYGRMEAQLGRPKEARTLTPREFATRARGRLHESRASLQALTALFEEARYSDHPMDEEDRAAALAALKDIESEMAGKVA
jgi:hypothetical protein